MIRRFPERALRMLHTFFQTCWTTGNIPKDWKKATVVAIHKNGKPPQQTSSYRPIALTPHLGKVYERVLKNRLDHHLEKNEILPLCQAGFRKGRNCMEHVVRLIEDTKKWSLKGKNKKTVATFFEIKKAFDSVWHAKLLNKMGALGITGRMYNFIQTFLDSREITVKDYKFHELMNEGYLLTLSLLVHVQQEDFTGRRLSTVTEQNTENDSGPVPAGGGDPDDGTDLITDLRHDDDVTSPTKGLRMPSLQARPTLVRTPSHLMREEEGVLITEVHHEEQEEEEEGVYGGEEEEQVEPEEEEEEEEEVRPEGAEYDTDLEPDDAEENMDRAQSYYHKVCGQLNIVPITYFLRHIHDPNLTMRFHGLCSEEAMAIALALRESVDVERLDLGGNWMMAEGARAITRLLEENEYITDMGLSENKLGDQGAEHVCRMLCTNGGLRKFNLKGNDFDDKSAASFAEALERNKYLRELDLSHNKFTEMGAEILGPAIGQNENLDVLDLSWNHLRPKGGVAIAKGLKENVRLKSLNLAWNGLGLEGGGAVAEALLTNQALLELDLSGNRLGLDTAKRMAKVLTTNDSIRVLKMGNNLITSGGAIALITAINNTDNCEVEELDLTDIEVEYEFLRVVEDTRMKRPNFVCRYGSVMRAGNTIDDLGKPGIDPFKNKKDPVVILQEHIVVNDTRLVDILKRYDASGSLSVSPEDFMAALEELAVPYNKEQLKQAVHRLADSMSGKIYFGDFVSQQTPSRPVSRQVTS
ncbi:hypothetical protein ACOMHN_019738 [Nucella lapillus]